MDQALSDRVTAYRTRHNIHSQSKAIQQLVRKGLGDDSRESVETKSGLPQEAGLDEQEMEIIRTARKLGPAQKALLLRLAEAVVAHTEQR